LISPRATANPVLIHQPLQHPKNNQLDNSQIDGINHGCVFQEVEFKQETNCSLIAKKKRQEYCLFKTTRFSTPRSFP
jgi:hypothetical protein